jgi:uncharacterized protein with HEPN domain
MAPDDRVRLQHIADALAAVAKFIQGRQRQDLDLDDMLRLALVQAIQIVGEAASRLTVEMRDRHPLVP